MRRKICKTKKNLPSYTELKNRLTERLLTERKKQEDFGKDEKERLKEPT